MTAAATWRQLSRAERAARVLPIVEAAVSGTSLTAAVVMGVIQQESDFYPDATATAAADLARGGAYGLMQMTLQTARGLGYKGAAGSRDTLTGLYDPAANVALGVRYLADLYRTTRDIDAAVSAYNAGLSGERAGDAKRTRNDAAAPFINQAYVDKVKAFAAAFDPVITLLTIAVVVGLGLALSGKVKL